MSESIKGARLSLALKPDRNPDVEASRKADDVQLPTLTREGKSDLSVAFGFAVKKATACPIFKTPARAICEIAEDRMSMRVQIVNEKGEPITEPTRVGDELRVVIKAF